MHASGQGQVSMHRLYEHDGICRQAQYRGLTWHQHGGVCIHHKQLAQHFWVGAGLEYRKQRDA
jgi:hypothetical protein